MIQWENLWARGEEVLTPLRLFLCNIHSDQSTAAILITRDFNIYCEWDFVDEWSIGFVSGQLTQTQV